MSRLARIQLGFQTKEGGQITSTALVINGRKIECIPVASFRILMGIKSVVDLDVARTYELTMIERDGINWATCMSALPHLGLTLSHKGD